MLNYRILCVGRRARDPILDATDDFLKRIKHSRSVELLRLKESNPEGERDLILSKLQTQDWVIALDERGDQWTTLQVADHLQHRETTGERSVSFIIGGADGLHPEVRARANMTLGLSRLTLPHRFALLLLCEQLYRVETIRQGSKYHRA